MTQNFNPRANTIARVVVVGVPVVAFSLLTLVIYIPRTPYSTRVDATIDQPVPFSHKHHVGELGIDCRYCHASVERTEFAGMPTTQTCMNCHAQVWTDAALLEPVRESWRTNRPIHWTRVHDTPDYVYFDHSIHINKGVGCSTCHGQIDTMPLVRKTQPMTMGWCLDCHRDPAPWLRPRDKIFDMAWRPKAAKITDARVPSPHAEFQGLTNCSTCHR